MVATRRNRVSDKNWGEIVRAYEVTTEDYLHVADALGMNRSMRRSIIALYIRERRMNQRTRGGRNHVKIDGKKELPGRYNQWELFIDAKPDKPRTTQRKANHLSISKALDGMLVSVKLARPVPAEWNHGDIIEARYEGRRNQQLCVYRWMWL